MFSRKTVSRIALVGAIGLFPALGCSSDSSSGDSLKADLLDAGSQPTELRYTADSGSTTQAVISQEQVDTIRLTGDNFSNYPLWKANVGTKVDSPTEVVISQKDMAVNSPDLLTPEEGLQYSQGIEEAKAPNVTLKIDDRGLTKDASGDAGRAISPSFDLYNGFLGAFPMPLLPVPSDAVGTGGSWRVHGSQGILGGHPDLDIEVTLKSASGTKPRVSFEGELESDGTKIDPTMIVPGNEAIGDRNEIRTASAKITGEGTFDLATASWSTLDYKTTGNQDILADRGQERVGVRTDLTVTGTLGPAAKNYKEEAPASQTTTTTSATGSNAGTATTTTAVGVADATTSTSTTVDEAPTTTVADAEGATQTTVTTG